jgi:hypothetical protein
MSYHSTLRLSRASWQFFDVGNKSVAEFKLFLKKFKTTGRTPAASADCTPRHATDFGQSLAGDAVLSFVKISDIYYNDYYCISLQIPLNLTCGDDEHRQAHESADSAVGRLGSVGTNSADSFEVSNRR